MFCNLYVVVYPSLFVIKPSLLCRYGKVFKSHLFGSPTIVSCDYEFNMFVLQNEGKLFEVDYPKVMHNILGKLSLLVVTGDHHKKLRNTSVSFICASKSECTFLHSAERLALSIVNSWQNCKQVSFYTEAKKVVGYHQYAFSFSFYASSCCL